MQLDKTRLVIRERGLLEIMDLALKLTRLYAWPLFLASAAGAVPMILFNNWVWGGLLRRSELEQSTPWGFLLGNLWFILWQIPLATAPTTLVLGQLLHTDKPNSGQVWRDFKQSLGQLIWYQVFCRGLMMVTGLLILWLMVGWAHLNEVILLERNPWRKKDSKAHSTISRAGRLHNESLGDLLVRWLLTTLLAAMFLLAILGSLKWMRWMLAGQDTPTEATYMIWWQVATWAVISYLTVVRYLSYLDLRIRLEGWEIELLMRAESERLVRHLA